MTYLCPNCNKEMYLSLALYYICIDTNCKGLYFEPSKLKLWFVENNKYAFIIGDFNYCSKYFKLKVFS